MEEIKQVTINGPECVSVPRSFLRPDLYIPGDLKRCENPKNVIQFAVGLFRTHPFVSDEELADTVCAYLNSALSGRSIVQDGINGIKFK